MTAMLTKALASPAGEDPLEFVMSDATVDRVGDVIEPSGWRLANFAKNPIALFGHDSSFVIGHWTNVRVERGRLLGRLELLRAGISSRLDEIRAAVEAGVLRAVSVGFRPIEAEPRGEGLRFTASELLECSLVSVPANPNALQLAKSLNLSAHAETVIFGKSAETASRVGPGETAASPHHPRTKTMTTLAQRIETTQTELNEARDQLTEHLKADDADAVVTAELTERIEQRTGALASFQRAEKALAGKAEPQVETKAQAKPFAAAARKTPAGDLVLRSAVSMLVAHVTRAPADVVLQRLYGEDVETKAVFDMIGKAASAPATTTTSGWAAELVQTSYADFMETLLPASIYPGLAARGLRLSFGGRGLISIPSRSPTPTIAGSFVGEGAPIPVRQGAFGATQLGPKKMAVISTFTREIATHSTPAIEGLVRDAIREDTSVALDSVLIDAAAANAIRPAGLRNGVAAITATSGGGFNALVGDIAGLVGALIGNTNGNVRAPVWIMNPVQKLKIGLTQNAGGDFPFKEEIARDVLQGFPVLASATVPAGMLILVDAADFVSVDGAEPQFEVSDQATLHMEDTSPAQIGTAGSPNVVAAPVRSMFQTDSLALRMIMPINWAMRRTGNVAWTQSVTW